MNLLVQRRAEIALRSLSPAERKKVRNSLEKLLLLDNIESFPFKGLRKLKSADLYSYPTGQNRRLRIILSKKDSEWIVEDILDRDRYNHL